MIVYKFKCLLSRLSCTNDQKRTYFFIDIHSPGPTIARLVTRSHKWCEFSDRDLRLFSRGYYRCRECIPIPNGVWEETAVSLITPGHRRTRQDTFIYCLFTFIEQQICLTIPKKYKMNKIWKFHSSNINNSYTIHWIFLCSPTCNWHPRTHIYYCSKVFILIES